MTNILKNLSEKILIATPYELEGGVFYKSLIYVLSHAKEGSIGLIINQLVKSLPLSMFIKQEPFFNEDKTFFNPIDKPLPIFFGGPNEIERMFFLHTNDYNKNLLFSSETAGIALSSNPQILQDILQGIGPEKNVSVVGYTLWGKGELEKEIENNFWIVSDYNKDLIFSNMQSTEKWDIALKNIGISDHLFTPYPGNA